VLSLLPLCGGYLANVSSVLEDQPIL